MMETTQKHSNRFKGKELVINNLRVTGYCEQYPDRLFRVVYFVHGHRYLTKGYTRASQAWANVHYALTNGLAIS